MVNLFHGSSLKTKYFQIYKLLTSDSLPFPNNHQVLVHLSGPHLLCPPLPHSTSHVLPLCPSSGLWHSCCILWPLSCQSATSLVTRERWLRNPWAWTHLGSPGLSPWSPPGPLLLHTDGQSTSLVLSHQHCELQLLGKRPCGHMGSGKASPVAQGSLEEGGRKHCRTEIKPES